MTNNEWFDPGPGLREYIAQQIAAAVPPRNQLTTQLVGITGQAGGTGVDRAPIGNFTTTIGTGLAVNADGLHVDVLVAGVYQAWFYLAVEAGAPTAFQGTISTNNGLFPDVYVPTDQLDGNAADIIVTLPPTDFAAGDQLWFGVFGDGESITWGARGHVTVWQVG